jgi:hypothetical protein
MLATASRDIWQIGADLSQLRTKGLSTPHLFDVYGVTPPYAASGEPRVYREIALFVLGCLFSNGAKVRSGTHFRLAGTIMLEICEARDCRACNGSGLHPQKRSICQHCIGNGIEPAPAYWRANTSDCHVRDFNERLHEVYERALRFVVESIRAARA